MSEGVALVSIIISIKRFGWENLGKDLNEGIVPEI